MKNSIRFTTNEYYSVHRKQPYGLGHWAFSFRVDAEDGGLDWSEVWFTEELLSFSQAKKRAQKEAESRGATVIKVCP